MLIFDECTQIVETVVTAAGNCYHQTKYQRYSQFRIHAYNHTLSLTPSALVVLLGFVTAATFSGLDIAISFSNCLQHQLVGISFSGFA